MIWKYEEQLKGFLEALNHHHPTIKFTYTMTKNEIAFLDSIVYRSPGSNINLEIRNCIHITTMLIPETRRNLSLLASLSDVEESAQITILKKPKIYNQLKYRKYPANLLKPSNPESKEHG